MVMKWHKNYKYCQMCKRRDKSYFAKGMCRKCYARKNWKNWNWKKTRGIFLKCTICGKKWQAKRPISRWYNPQFCHFCVSRMGAQRKKQVHQTKTEKRFNKPLKVLLRELYCGKKMGGLKAAAHLGISPDQFYRWGNEMGIKFRDPFFKKGNQLFKGLIPHNRGKTLEEVLGKQRAQEIKEYNQQNMRKENKKRWVRGTYKNSRMGAGISGKRKDVGFKRSSWEANLARVFIYQKKKFQYEPKIFYLGKSDKEKILFIPDFRIGNTWWEIKGWLDKRSLEKIKLFLKQYPNKNLIIVGKTGHFLKNQCVIKNCKFIDYFKLEKKFKPLILNWETDRVNLKTHPELFQ